MMHYINPCTLLFFTTVHKKTNILISNIIIFLKEFTAWTDKGVNSLIKRQGINIWQKTIKQYHLLSFKGNRTTSHSHIKSATERG